MKYETKSQANLARKVGPLPEKHKAVKTQYLDLETWEMVSCWTIVFIK